MTTQPLGIPEGIYSSRKLSNEAYHDDPALSHSGMTKVLVSWPDYWVSSCLNPNRKKFNATDAMVFGQRAGMLLLEPETFHETYNTHGRPMANARKPYLSSIEWERLHESVRSVMDVPYGADHFKYGYPEVSVFFRLEGVMVRVRFDYLRTFGVIDYKRIAEVNSIAIGRAVKAQGLDIQAYLYLEGLKAARSLLRHLEPSVVDLLALREGFDVKWLRALRDDNDLLFRFLFQRSTPPYIWEFRELENEVMMEGANAVRAAITRYKYGLQKYGVGKPPLGEDKLKTISQYHVPRRDYDFETDA